MFSQTKCFSGISCTGLSTKYKWVSNVPKLMQSLFPFNAKITDILYQGFLKSEGRKYYF